MSPAVPRLPIMSTIVPWRASGTRPLLSNLTSGLSGAGGSSALAAGARVAHAASIMMMMVSGVADAFFPLEKGERKRCGRVACATNMRRTPQRRYGNRSPAEPSVKPSDHVKFLTGPCFGL